MIGSRRLRLALSAVILSLLTTLPCLLSTDAAHASPVISCGSTQMSVGGTQTMTVSGDCGGPYGWSIVSGGGSLSDSSGTSVIYTAPSQNPDCQGNASIACMDACGEIAVITIAVNNPAAMEAAYYKNHGGCSASIPGGGQLICGKTAPSFQPYNWAADCTTYHLCDGSIYGSGNRVGCWSIAYNGCDPYGNGWCGQNETGPLPPLDVRSPAQKAAGCCPTSLPGTGAPGPGSMGGNGGNGNGGNGNGNGGNGNGNGGNGGNGNGGNGDCSSSNPNVVSESAANLTSGNLFFSQEAAGLTLSYNSIDPYSGPVGKKWTHNYNVNLTPLSDNSTLKLKAHDGNIIYFRLSSGIYYPEAISGDTSRIVKNSDTSYTRTFKDGLIHHFSSAGRLVSISDRNGNTTTLTYSGNNLASITTPSGRTTTIATTGGLITSISDPAGRTYNLAYTGGLLSSITDPLGNVWHYTYNTAGRMLTKIDPASRTVTYTYDTSGRLLTSTDPESKARTMTYTQTGTTALTEKDGGIWTYQYDPTFAVKTQKTDPLGNITRYRYDLKRNLVSVTDPSGGITRYTYDGNRNVISVTDPLNHTTSYTYNALNLIASRTDSRGGVTTYGYDTYGNLTSTTEPVGTTTHQYNTKGNITTITDADNRTTVLTYDTQNNLTSITDPQGHTTTFTYDTIGNRLTMTDPLNHTTTYTFNALNQMTQAIDPLGHITHFTYDYQGNVLTTTDANNKPTGYEYNYRGQRTRITDALNHITQMNYGPTGCGSGCGGAEKLTSLTDTLNHVTGYSYDLAGRMVKETDPKGQEIFSTYDARGNLITRTKPDGRTITYTYDAADRLIQKQYPGGSVVQYQYDANGNMTYAGNSAIAYNFTYDTNNRLTQVTDTNSKTIQYQYSAGGKRTTVVTPENKTIAYTYDSVGRPATVASEGRTFTLGYDAASRRTGLSFPNGTAVAYTYDNNGNLTQIRHTGPGATVLAEINHTYDAVNNRLTRTDTAASGTESAGTETMTHSTANELLSINTTTYCYDANGNRVLKITTGGNTAYVYDDENQLIQVVTDGGQTIAYSYDPLGRRIEKNVNGTITRYLYDQEDILLEYSHAGTVTARYLHGPGIDEPLAMEKNGQMYYYHADSLGSIIALTNNTGAVVQSYQYDAFGNILSGTPAVAQPYTYTAREYDPETGLYFYRARYYDPKAGRFLTKDPISFAGGDVNLYAYVGNNPVNATDPEGLEIWICNRKASWSAGNHAYLWNDRNSSCCGTGSTKKCKENGPNGDSCRIVVGSGGKEDSIMKCCKDTADNGLWFPVANDCHGAADDCIVGGGLKNPGAPGGRTGPPCDPCK